MTPIEPGTWLLLGLTVVGWLAIIAGVIWKGARDRTTLEMRMNLVEDTQRLCPINEVRDGVAEIRAKTLDNGLTEDIKRLTKDLDLYRNETRSAFIDFRKEHREDLQGIYKQLDALKSIK